MKIESPAFLNQTMIPAPFTCNGSNTNPPLIISDVPQNSESLVLIVDDPDAPNGTWTHWTVWNINPDTTTIEENSLPNGSTQGLNSFGKEEYGGPCPPSGMHRYFFKLYALDTKLDLSPNTDKTALEEAMKDHIIEESVLIGLYAQKR